MAELMTNGRPAGASRWAGVGRSAFTLLGVAAVVLGVVSTGWLIVIADQWLLPWQTLSVLAPPR